MSERINKLYKPAELEAAIKLIEETDFENKASSQVVIDWHKQGWRLMRMKDD